MSDPFDLSDDEPRPLPTNTLPARTPWLDDLNPEQRQAVETTEGPVLVLSGAGTGKTRVLTSRLAHIVITGRSRPWNVLAVTFTNKAAREMRERVSILVGPMAEQLWLGTFHALGVKMLRRHARLVGLESNFTILDTDDQLRLLKQVMEAEKVDSKRWPAQALMSSIQRWKDRGLTPSQVTAGDAGDFASGRSIQLFQAYQDRLCALNACDFGDLLLHCLSIFRNPAHADVLTEYQQQFRYILVDEYQDTNVAQYLWLRLLAQKHKNICCVGDDDQSIYSWRGAEVGNILKFEHDFPGATVVRLEANYRSTPVILAAASALIRHNEGRLGKTLRPGGLHQRTGEPVIVRGLWDGVEEARWLVEEIEARHRDGTSLNEIAILVRAGFQTREFEERLITTGIPYKVVGGLRFYERQEIRDALAYFRVVVQPADDLAFERIVNVPKRGLGEATLQAVHVLARDQGVSLVAAARQLGASDDLKPKARSTLVGLLDDFDRWRSLLSALSHGELAATILDESGYTGMWQREKTPDAQGRLENLKELAAAMDEFDSMASFLEHVSLVMENDEKTDVERVNVMTLHGAKGLEFDVVFLPGWEEGVFPHQRAMEESGTQGLEEERRLAYVGLTRARQRLFISYAASRRIYNQWQNNLPSRFVEELPSDMVERIAEKGLFGGTTEAATAWGASWNSGYVTQRQRRQDEDISQIAATAPDDGYAPGDRVFHQKFGYGRVQAVDGNKLEIAFDKAGNKKIIDSFISLA
jgi:DNA helicase-2/ATP-dependent DNA helicase PcrA